MYRIKIDSDFRIVEAVYTKEDDGSGIFIDNFPGEPIDDYKYINGQVVYDPIPNRPQYDPDAPTPLDILAKDNKMLHQQVEALTGQNTFLEECIAEMAGVVYA